jgi:radical SAM superfamily enzyme YgiQ (UPF0313 family)
MEPMPVATIAGLLPENVERRFYDDRLEAIPYDEPTDLVLMSVETFTARRCYQIANAYHRRGVRVVMGGFHATLCPDEVAEYCDAVVVGEAESLVPRLIDDARHGTLERVYQDSARPDLAGLQPDRTIFRGKRYLRMGLLEFARGCRFKCEFCAVQSFFGATHRHRPVEDVVAEIARIRAPGKVLFFIDDNICSDLEKAKELMRALIPLNVKWVSQSSINVAFDDEAMDLMRRSGCQLILVGLESLNAEALGQMNKKFNLMKGGARAALDRFRSYGIAVYGTFIFGYDADTPDTIDTTVRFARDEGLFIAAFNHITPFPGTPLYARLQRERRLRFDAWWNDPAYRYNMVPFHPSKLSATSLEESCLDARRTFYSWPSIANRARTRANRRNPILAAHYVLANAMHHGDVVRRSGMPLGHGWEPPPYPIHQSSETSLHVVR